MPELKVEDVKSELDTLVKSSKDQAEKSKLKQMPEDQRKAEEAKKAETVKKEAEDKQKAEEQAKKDAEILSKKPEELNDEEKKRVDVLLEEKRKKEEDALSVEEKLKRIEEKTQKRINEIINEKKQIEDKNSKEFEALTSELAQLKKQNEELVKQVKQTQPGKDELQAVVIKNENERIARYLEEDKHKPRNERREMPKQEIEEWMLEDMVAAQEWLVDRRARRDAERADDAQSITYKSKAQLLIKKQNESLDRVIKANDELKDANSDKSKLLKSIIEENKDLLLIENGPELAMAEVEKRLKAKSTPSESDSKIAELEKKIEMLTARLQADGQDIGINSMRQIKRDSSVDTPEEKQLRETMREVGLPEDKIEARIRKFREEKKG